MATGSGTPCVEPPMDLCMFIVSAQCAVRGPHVGKQLLLLSGLVLLFSFLQYKFFYFSLSETESCNGIELCTPSFFVTSVHLLKGNVPKSNPLSILYTFYNFTLFPFFWLGICALIIFVQDNHIFFVVFVAEKHTMHLQPAGLET